MLTTMEQMPDTARLWVYQADRKFDLLEKKQVVKLTEEFIERWAAHGNPLKASFEIIYNQFLIISVDESYNQASGCSIDESVSLLREIQGNLGISFLDRSKIAFLINDDVVLKEIPSLKSAILDHEIDRKTKVMNNSVSNYKDFKESWIQPADESWLKRFF